MLLALASLSLLWPTFVVAQGIVSCTNSTWWAPLRNEVQPQEDPCLVALIARKQCGGQETQIGIQNQEFQDITTLCLCHGQAYAVFQACLACQSDQPPLQSPFTTWKDWSNGCQPPRLGNQLTVDFPDWAMSLGPDYESGKSTFTVNGALNEAANPRPLSTTSTLVTPTNPTSTTVVVVEATEVSTASGSSKSSKGKTGAIVGGIVGALIVLAIIAGVFLFLRRRKQDRQVAPSSEFTKYHQKPQLQSTSPPSPTHAPLQGSSVSGAGGSSYTPLRQGSGDESGIDEELPSFTPGMYTGPVYEKPGQYISDPNSPLHTNSIGHSTSQGLGRKA